VRETAEIETPALSATSCALIRDGKAEREPRLLNDRTLDKCDQRIMHDRSHVCLQIIA